MEFLKANKRLSFLYGGEDAFSLGFQKTEEENGNTLITTYLFADGLKVTNVAKKYPKYDAYEWVNYFENTGNEKTKIISGLWDCDVNVEIGEAVERSRSPWFKHTAQPTKIYNPNGSNYDDWEFGTHIDDFKSAKYINSLYVGDSKKYKCDGGRSSSGESAPYFNVHNNGRGVVVAVGWTGQWNVAITQEKDSVRLQSKIEDTHFCLMPNEKIRTSSVVIMNYEGDYYASQNKWRRLVRDEFSIIGKRQKYAPFCAGVWGGMESEKTIANIEKVCKSGIPIEYVWMDAGWYGENTKPTANEFEGDWPEHTGDWTISPLIHPNGLKDVAAKIGEYGKKFLLWFESERTVRAVKHFKEHPEQHIILEDADLDYAMLNIGNEDAYEYCLEMLSEHIRELNISCYRQDFNFNPLAYWRKNDTPDRQGISEIRYITALYKLWDTLLERFPHLIIDNCASGGRRLDIEMMRRSVPLWRSDSECDAVFPAEFVQSQNINYSLWLPYSGTGCGRMSDTYRIRSAYAPGMTTQFSWDASDGFLDDAEFLSWFKARGEEFLRIRPYFDGDIYPLTESSVSKNVWSAVQWDRPKEKDGMIQVFRREESPYQTAVFALRGINAEKNYLITDIDGGEFEISGKELAEKGFSVTVEERPTAKIYFYREI